MGKILTNENMVKITEDLIRKKSEHNESIIGTLEELSLHQEDVDKIENVQNWCRDLEILLLQSNLINKIENLHKLKKLKYLNLAVNNIEVIENLERCESLEKLDLTLNFIGDLESVRTLQKNIHLRELYLTGNPCSDYKGYREYVIANLLDLQYLDGGEISRTERLKAMQKLAQIASHIVGQQNDYRLKRQEQKLRLQSVDHSGIEDDAFWRMPSEHAPEIRCEISKRSRQTRGKDDKNKKEEAPESEKKPALLFNSQGLPLNINQAKLGFTFNEGDAEFYHLDIAVYKFLDSSYIDVDIQPKYVTVRLKGKVFQFVFPGEVSTSESKAQRSQITGHLLIKAKKVNFQLGPAQKKVPESPESFTNRNKYLDVPDRLETDMDFSKITEKWSKDLHPEVPPLEFA